MRRTMKAAIVGATVVAAAGVTTAAAVAGSDDDATDTPITGVELEKAEDAALAHTHGGRVTETEVGDEESYYEVEVTLPDGRQVDVQLDRDFQVVGDESDSESESDD
jgi:uncharacterized membrane protein YkoI